MQSGGHRQTQKHSQNKWIRHGDHRKLFALKTAADGTQDGIRTRAIAVSFIAAVYRARAPDRIFKQVLRFSLNHRRALARFLLRLGNESESVQKESVQDNVIKGQGLPDPLWKVSRTDSHQAK